MNIEAGTSRWSAVISACTVAASLDHRTQYMDGPPALLKGYKKKKKGEVLHLFRCYTHTDTDTDTDTDTHRHTHRHTHTHVITHTHTSHTHTHIPHTHTYHSHHTHITHTPHTHTHTHITHTHTHSQTHWLLRGRRVTWCTAKGSDVRPGVPLASLGLRRSAGGFCVAGAGLGALQRGRMYAWRLSGVLLASLWRPSGVPWSPPLCRWLLRGRRGTWR